MANLNYGAIIVFLLLSLFGGKSDSFLIRNSSVSTLYGDIRGIETKNGIEWRGIPFGASTANQNRWKAPQKPQKWEGIRNANRYRANCPQLCPTNSNFCSNETSEDCLYLNVWAPLTIEKNQKNPVIFVIPGAEFEFADASAPIYIKEGASLFSNQSNSIIVIANYRVGPLGFLVSGDGKGNFGFLDQIAALQWVKDNILRFGGDSNRVTIVGDSFGALSSSIHLISPNSKGLFQGIIMQSNCLGASLDTPEQAQSWSAILSSFLGCGINDESCLRSKSFQEILKASLKVKPAFSGITLNGTSLSIPWSPVIDGEVVPSHPLIALKHGRYHSVPTIVGTAAEEGRMFVYRYLKNSFPNYEFVALVTAAFGKNALTVLNKYKPSYYPFSDTRPLLAKLFTDAFFTCPTRRLVNLLYKNEEKTFLYEFDHILQRPFGYWGENRECNYHICNGAEFPFLWSSLSTFSPTEKILSESLKAYWGNFANRGDPNTKEGDLPRRGMVNWNVYSNEDDDDDNENVRSFLRVDTPNTLQRDLRIDECDFWDSMDFQNR